MVSACPGPQDRILSSLGHATSPSFSGCAISHVILIHSSFHLRHIYKISPVCLATDSPMRKSLFREGKTFAQSHSFLRGGTEGLGSQYPV